MGANIIVKKTINATKKKFCSNKIETVPIKVALSSLSFIFKEIIG